GTSVDFGLDGSSATLMAAGTIPCVASDPCPVSLLAVAAPEKINGHGRANKNDESFDPGLRQFLRIMRGGITAENRPENHYDGLWPENDFRIGSRRLFHRALCAE